MRCLPLLPVLYRQASSSTPPCLFVADSGPSDSSIARSGASPDLGPIQVSNLLQIPIVLTLQKPRPAAPTSHSVCTTALRRATSHPTHLIPDARDVCKFSQTSPERAPAGKTMSERLASVPRLDTPVGICTLPPAHALTHGYPLSFFLHYCQTQPSWSRVPAIIRPSLGISSALRDKKAKQALMCASSKLQCRPLSCHHMHARFASARVGHILCHSSR
jgi:hypothetical protein